MQNRSSLEQSTKLAILISSKWPGAGLTTAANEVVARLDLERVTNAGQIRRAICHHWNEFKDRHKQDKHFEQTENSLWFEFTNAYQLAYELAMTRGDIGSLQLLLFPHLDAVVSNNELNQFSETQEQYSTSAFLDVIPDLVAYSNIQKKTQKPGYLHEGKLAYIFDYMLARLSHQSAVLLEELPGQSMAIVRVLLTVNEETAAQRVLKRELEKGKRIPPENATPDWYGQQLDEVFASNKKRIDDDRIRLQKAYGVTPQELDQFEHDAKPIDTSTLSQDEVVRAVLARIAHELTNMPTVAPEIIDALAVEET